MAEQGLGEIKIFLLSPKFVLQYFSSGCHINTAVHSGLDRTPATLYHGTSFGCTNCMWTPHLVVATEFLLPQSVLQHLPCDRCEEPIV
jgi:hypothetical protein